MVAAKVVGASALGGLIALRFLPGNIWQRSISFVSSVGIGCLAGGAAAERFSLIAGSYMQLSVAAIAAVFGLAVINNAMQQIPEWLTAARKRYIGGE